jgi:hypothetical protein
MTAMNLPLSIPADHRNVPSAAELYAVIADLSLRVARLESQLEAAAAAAPAAHPAPERPQARRPVTFAQELLATEHPAQSHPAPAADPQETPTTVRLDRISSEPPLPQLLLDEPEPEPVRRGPKKVEVVAAIERYPRVIEKIRLFWDDPRCAEFLKTLVIDDRGTRTGFPPDIMAELLTLTEISYLKFGQTSRDIWDEQVTEAPK